MHFDWCVREGGSERIVFLMVGFFFLKMQRKLLDEGGLMADRLAENFYKDLLIFGCVSMLGLCK